MSRPVLEPAFFMSQHVAIDTKQFQRVADSAGKSVRQGCDKAEEESVMADARGWPDPARPGFPENPERDGPHLVIDASGGRGWVWWESAVGFWQISKMAGIEEPEVAGQEWTYLGPAIAPDGKPVP